ncbi:MAG: hypothetical protein C0402_06400 [Thermodesulfovibrio sp.]|nr:hypothetical protein [Thermodesulfovibrio sp.]
MKIKITSLWKNIIDSCKSFIRTKGPGRFEGKLLTGIEGTDGGRVYYIEDAKKRWVISPEIFQKAGFRGEDIQRVADAEIDEIAEGYPLDSNVRVYTKCTAADTYIIQNNVSELSDTPQWIKTRHEFSRKYIRGNGIEIGAHHAPLQVEENTIVRYVDILSAEENNLRFPELKSVPIDILDDGEYLSAIEDESIDFIIANHFLEHCQNPLGTLRTHLSKLRPGGIIYYAVPNKDYTFDKTRPLTSFEHLVRDDKESPAVSRLMHYAEWIEFVENNHRQEEIMTRAKKLETADLRIHFHVWDRKGLEGFVADARSYLDNQFLLECIHENGIECIIVLSKTRKGSSV